MPPRLLIAPDSFKGTFSSATVAAAIARGVRAGGAEPDPCPAADGGEGTAAAIRAACAGSTRRVRAHDPLGRPIAAEYALLDDGATAAIDTAAASGLPLLDPGERDAEAADTRGTGELIVDAVAQGARRILLSAGGSATTDGGWGAVQAIEECGGMGRASIHVLCDVRTKFEDAARIFGPQKGADADGVVRLGRRLDGLAAKYPRDPRGIPMTGCAGGLSGGLWAAFDASLEPGAAFVLGVLEFDRRLSEADAVISGEGRLDSQSAEGKLVGEIAAACGRAGRDLHLLVGSDQSGERGLGSPAVRTIREAGSLEELEAAGRELAAAYAGRA